jgi:hypothetical protein
VKACVPRLVTRLLPPLRVRFVVTVIRVSTFTLADFKVPKCRMNMEECVKASHQSKSLSATVKV